MPVRLPIGRTLFLLAAFVFTLVALFPLRLALDRLGFEERGLAARSATGSVWNGALQEARIGPVALGDVHARLNLLPLFLGRARLSVIAAEENGLVGAVSVSRHGFGFEDFDGRIRAGTLFAPLPLTSLDFDDLSAGFAGGRCVRADGGVRAIVSAQAGGIGISPELVGRARCAGDALLLPLAGRSGMERLDVRIFPDGRYRLDLLVRSTDPAVGAALAAAGFRRVAQGYAMRIDGAF
ncbi:type II secretion system protein N [Sphingosinicella sp. CPCC 101087]|uniref:type II secretion system protein N n=1 Tax=Sphingosinicella sp. CPCC 101087 TaxID=2497754 RepID=UPI00101D5813|nr:type II secretion system protein N [Sphingosinicella sp. CPCC 101087]